MLLDKITSFYQKKDITHQVGIEAIHIIFIAEFATADMIAIEYG